MRELRPHQLRAVDALYASLAGGKRRPLCQLPTGGGKTLLSAHIIARAIAKGRRITFTVPAISLVDQTVHEFWREGIRDVGVIQGNHAMTSPGRPVQIASVQSLARRGYPETDLVIVDEAHRRFEIIKSWMGERPTLPFVGLSATPWAKGLGQDYDDLIIAATTNELIEAGWLSRFRVFAPSHPDLTGVRTVAGDYHEGELSGAMQPLTGDVVATWLDRGENRPTLCFAVDCAHAKHLHERFESVGVSSAYIDADTDLLERERIRRAFHSGETKVVCNVGVMTTGVDWDVRCLILARPTKSEMLYVQIIGRALRTAEGKQDALILDHSDTTLRLGFVTDIHHDELCDGTGRKKESSGEGGPPLPKECPKCSHLRPPKSPSCPNCGFKPERQAAGVEVEDGALVELESRAKAKANKEAGWEEKVTFVSELRCYAEQTGKKPGWVAYKYKEKFGVWPNDPRVRDAPQANNVSPRVQAWIKSRAIAWANARNVTEVRP